MGAGAYYGARRYAQARCIQQKLRAGKSLHAALRECGAENGTLYDYITGKPVANGNFNVGKAVADALKLPENTPMGRYVRALVGDVDVNNSGVTVAEGEDVTDLMLDNNTRRAAKTLTALVAAARRGPGNFTQAIQKEINDPNSALYAGTGDNDTAGGDTGRSVWIPIDYDTARAIAMLSPPERYSVIRSLAVLWGYMRTLDDLRLLRKKLEALLAQQQSEIGKQQIQEEIRKVDARIEYVQSMIQMRKQLVEAQRKVFEARAREVMERAAEAAGVSESGIPATYGVSPPMLPHGYLSVEPPNSKLKQQIGAGGR